MDVVQFMKQWHFSFYHGEEAVRHLIHRQRPFYSMTPRDEWDDGIRECGEVAVESAKSAVELEKEIIAKNAARNAVIKKEQESTNAPKPSEPSRPEQPAHFPVLYPSPYAPKGMVRRRRRGGWWDEWRYVKK